MLICRSHCKGAQKSQFFEIKSSPCHQPWCSFCRRGCWPQQVQNKALLVNSKGPLTLNGNFCSSISRNEHERSFLSTLTRGDGLHSLTYIHTLRRGGGPYAPNSTPSPCKTIAWTSQLSSSHVRPIHRRSDCRPTWRQQANLARTSKQPLTSYGLLARASRGRRLWAPFFYHSNISKHVFAHARGPRSDRDPRRSREFCARVTPRRRTKEPLS